MAASNTDTQRRTSNLTAQGARTLAYVGLCIAMMWLDHRGPQLDSVRNGLSFVVYPIQALVSLPSRFVDWSASSSVSRSDLERENNALKVERLRTRAELQKFNDLEAENHRLRAMLSASDKVADNYSMAEIMAVDANRYRHSIVINKGHDRQVYEGQAMVDANGVIGQIISVSQFSSVAMLISDPDHALPVEVVRNGLRTFALGTGELDRLVLPYLPNNADIEVGDLLVTSGLGGAFPSGYPVATVSAVDRKPGDSFASIRAVPAARLDQVREIVLIEVPEVSEPMGADRDVSSNSAENDVQN